MSDPRVPALLKLGAGRMGSVSAPKWPAILQSMPPVGALAFAKDHRQGVIALAGRGAGKSTAMAAKFHRVSAAHPNQSSVFIAISRERARDILLPAIWMLNNKYDTGIVERRGDWSVVWPNGYRLLFRGCGERSECDKRRGTPWVAAGWDECASINSSLLQYDIHDCVEPRLMDFKGQWFAGGTPGPVQHGYWYKLSSGEAGYPVHEWDARTNPYYDNVLKFMIDALTRMGGVPERRLWPAHCTSVLDIINDPKLWHLLPATFVREYLGKWVLDLKALIYKLTPRNSYSELPIDPDFWTIGCDLGAHSPDDPDLDHAAISVCASQRSLPYIWVPESHKLSDITVESLAAHLSQLCEKYPQASVHIDSASAGKIIETSFRRMGIPIQAAIKGPKLRRIQLVQSAIANGNLQLHIRETMDLRHEATALVWDDTRTLHSERCADDAWDSLLMAAIPHFGEYKPEEVPPEVGSKEWQQAQELAEYEAALQAAIDESTGG